MKVPRKNKRASSNRLQPRPGNSLSVKLCTGKAWKQKLLEKIKIKQCFLLNNSTEVLSTSTRTQNYGWYHGHRPRKRCACPTMPGTRVFLSNSLADPKDHTIVGSLIQLIPVCPSYSETVRRVVIGHSVNRKVSRERAVEVGLWSPLPESGAGEWRLTAAPRPCQRDSDSRLNTRNVAAQLLGRR